MEPDRQQNDRPVVCLIAQQYSPPPFFFFFYCSSILSTEILAGRLKMLFEIYLVFSKLYVLKLSIAGVYFTPFTTNM
jgi:hypothetical protein